MIFWTWTANAASACDLEGIGRMVDAVSHAAPEYAPTIALTGFAEACPEPAAVASAARTWLRAEPPERRAIDLGMTASAPEAWAWACPSRYEVGMAAPEELRGNLYAACTGLGPWASPIEWSSASGPVVIPLVAGAVLTEAGASPDVVRRAVRAMAGVGVTEPQPLLLGTVGVLGRLDVEALQGGPVPAEAPAPTPATASPERRPHPAPRPRP